MAVDMMKTLIRLQSVRSAQRVGTLQTLECFLCACRAPLGNTRWLVPWDALLAKLGKQTWTPTPGLRVKAASLANLLPSWQRNVQIVQLGQPTLIRTHQLPALLAPQVLSRLSGLQPALTPMTVHPRRATAALHVTTASNLSCVAVQQVLRVPCASQWMSVLLTRASTTAPVSMALTRTHAPVLVAGEVTTATRISTSAVLSHV